MAEEPTLIQGFGEWAVNFEDKREKILIPRVPEYLRSRKPHEKCFDPVLVSLGPYHYRKENLKRMESYKLDAVRRFTNSVDDYSNAELYFEKFRNVAEEARKSYDIQPEEFGDDFAKIMFMDSCFILDFINDGFEEITKPTNAVAEAAENTGKDHQEKSVSSTWTMKLDVNLLARDVMLLENQIPLLLLRELMSITGRSPAIQSNAGTITSSGQGNNTNKRSKMENIMEKFVMKLLFQNDNQRGKNDECLHLLDLCRKMFLGEPTRSSDGTEANKSKEAPRKEQQFKHYFRSVKELSETGIKFRCSRISSPREIEFEDGLLGKLYLPHINIDDMTRCLFSNMIAFELGLCIGSASLSTNYNVVSYVCFMDYLIDREEDVKILREKNILQNALGSDQEVASLFNELATDLSPERDAYADVKEKINKHLGSKWKCWFGNLYHTRIRSPWKLTALISAIFLLALAALQTFYSHRQVVLAAHESKH